jgi:hypothetical protein
MFNSPFILGSAGEGFNWRIGFSIEETVPCAASFRSSPQQRPCSSSRVSRSPEAADTVEDMVEVTAAGTTPQVMAGRTTSRPTVEHTMPPQPTT